MREFVEVFRHQQPFVVEIAMDELRKKDIPCFMQQGSITGLEMSPVCPAAAPGVEYVVYVHKSKLKRAKKIMDELPIDKELLNVTWSKYSDRKMRKLQWVFLAVAIIPALAFLFWMLYCR